MRIYVFIIFVLLLNGCGGGGGDTSSTGYPSQSFGGTSYDTWDYIKPSSNLQGESINNKELGGMNYSAKFIVSENSTTEIPDDAEGEKIVYDKLEDRVKITFYKDEKKTFSYEMKKTIHIGETTTVSDSACVLVKYYPSYPINGVYHDDVIQIDCGKSTGFYQKGHGEIAQQ